MQGECAGDARDPARSGPTRCSSRASPPNTSTPQNPDAIDAAEFLNENRFLSLDLTYGHHVDAEMYEYLLDNGMTREEYDWFMEQPR